MNSLIIIGKIIGIIFVYFLTFQIVGLGLNMLSANSDFEVGVGIFILAGVLATFLTLFKNQIRYIKTIVKQIVRN